MTLIIIVVYAVAALAAYALLAGPAMWAVVFALSLLLGVALTRAHASRTG